MWERERWGMAGESEVVEVEAAVEVLATVAERWGVLK